MHFYGPLFKQGGHLTMRSAFVRSGALWSPFPLVTTVAILVFVIVLVVVFVRDATPEPSTILVIARRLLKSSLWALVALLTSTLLALFTTFVFELIIYAPAEVIALASKQASSEQRLSDETDFQKRSSKLLQDLKDAQDALAKRDEVRPRAYIGISKTVYKKSEDSISVDLALHNYGTASAENIASVGSLVVNDQIMTAGTISPPTRILPNADLHFRIEMASKTLGGLAPVFKLIEQKKPVVVTVNLYFLSDGLQYSQQTIQSYDYRINKWELDGDQVLNGFVAMPFGVRNKIPQYVTAPWLPPLSPAMTANATLIPIPVVPRTP